MKVPVTYTRVNLGAGNVDLLAAKTGYRACLLGLYGSFQGNATLRSDTTAIFDWDASAAGAPSLVSMQQGIVPWALSDSGEALNLLSGTTFNAIALCYYLPDDSPTEIQT